MITIGPQVASVPAVTTQASHAALLCSHAWHEVDVALSSTHAV
jgi:hypothetical protein